ncbi:uncharacterized protein LOC134813871 [Bolinopsis microptera]|uniref:uncharacterized protein LOC134813871 n=1 Tax=Bolinopsis microptera TaxID=2820187 RepID=UPI00307A20EE
MSPLMLVLLSVGFTLVHIATAPKRDVTSVIDGSETLSPEQITYITVFFTQAIVAPLATLMIKKCSKNKVLVFGVVLCGSWFITVSLHLPPAVHFGLAICLGVANAIINTALLHIIAGKDPFLPGTTSFSGWSATLGFSYAVAGIQMFFISPSSDTVVPDSGLINITDQITPSNTTSITSTDLLQNTKEILTAIAIYIIGGGCILASSLAKRCSSNKYHTIQIEAPTEPRQLVKLSRKACAAVGAMVMFYGFMGSILLELFAVCSASIGFKAQSVTCFGIAFLVMSLYVTYKGKSELTTSAVLSTLLVVGFILTGVLFPADCIAGDEFYMIGSAAFLIPMAGMFLGGGSGLLTCEVLSLVSMGWSTDFKYAALVASQGFWAAVSTFIPSLVHPRNFLIIMTILAVIYYFLAFYVHEVLRNYHKLRARERMLREYGSVDEITKNNPHGTYKETTRGEALKTIYEQPSNSV